MKTLLLQVVDSIGSAVNPFGRFIKKDIVVGDYRIITVTHPLSTDYNPDLVVFDEYEGKLIDGKEQFPLKRCIKQTRVSKLAQSKVIKSIASDIDDVDFRHTPTLDPYSIIQPIDIKHQLGAGPYILKPNAGASSENVFLVPATALIKVLKNRKDLIQAPVSLGVELLGTHTGLEYSGWVMQRADKAVKEYRVIFSNTPNGKRSYMMVERRLAEDDHGFKLPLNDAPSKAVAGSVRKDLKVIADVLIDRTGMALGSVDIFERADGSYGIYEYSAQYACNKMPKSFNVEKFHHDFLLNWIREAGL